MPKREPIKLGNKTFKTKDEAAKHVRKLMESYSDNEAIVGENLDIVMDVLRRFPNAEQKIGLGIKNVYLKVGIGTDRYFLIHRVDNTWVTSGYKGAFFPKNDLNKFHEACRQAVSDETYGRIAFPMGKPEGFEVHHVKQFKDVVNDFIGLYNIDISTIKYRKAFNRTPEFEDTKLAQSFMEYCRQFAVLRLLHKDVHKIETTKQRRKYERYER